jgi:dCMP deaminase
MTNWDKKFIDLANHISLWSKDTNRKVGAVVIDKDNIVLSMGYNGFPRGVDDSIESRYDRPDKYLFTEHAERNCLYHAARHGVSLKGSTIYMTLFCCSDCARGIIQSGITRVVSFKPDLEHETWGTQFKTSLIMFEEAKVKVDFFNS